MFLTREEIINLTGYKYRNKQIQWLLNHGYKFDISADGSPKVLIAFVEALLGYEPSKHKRKPPELNLSNSKFFGKID